ncbi:hypothetical protein EV421DRAFT_1845037 [Armillaria borealis]|uniref:Uncharacterized protein n=1 Tax=Armillaria borealis TaxID=47425 RepID=A0AA39J300_9AGAR|nr:hypothetical protein EV421DRAFT_1845037 [Armillaria borealis]
MELPTAPFIVPSALAANLSNFSSWTRAALVDDLPSPTSTPAVEAQREVITRFELPESLEKSLIAATDDPLEGPMTQEFARKILAAYAGRFTSTADDNELVHTWKHLAGVHANLAFSIDPEICFQPSESTTRSPVDSLMLLAVRTLSTMQVVGPIRYQHDVTMAMAKTYHSPPPFVISKSFTCGGQANYRVSTEDETEIDQFAYNHDVTKEVSTEAGSDICYFLLAMFAIEYNNDSAAAFHQLLMDFAAILRHRQLLGFSFDYLLGMTGCHYTGSNSFRLKFFLGALDGERGRVKSWDVGELDIMRPEELLQAYIWISNSISQFVAFANGWHFDSSAPRDLEKLAWRADGSEKGSR